MGFRVYSTDGLCFKVEVIGIPPSTAEVTWSDGAGRTLALGSGNSSSVEIVCGPFDGGPSFLNLKDRVPAVLAPGPLPSCGAWGTLFWP